MMDLNDKQSFLKEKHIEQNQVDVTTPIPKTHVCLSSVKVHELPCSQ